jgi:hypothetical protein
MFGQSYDNEDKAHHMCQENFLNHQMPDLKTFLPLVDMAYGK